MSTETGYFHPVDKAPLASDAELRSELGIEGDVIAGLDRLVAGRRPFLVVDALDAARSDQARTFVLGLIRRVRERPGSEWTVLVSIRTYDAMRSLELEALFPQGELPDSQYQLPTARCSHFLVPALSDPEVAAAEAELPWLAGLWEAAHAELRALLRVPLHLWLVSRLFEGGVDPAEVSLIRSEVQLLGLFWRQRVRSGNLEPDQRLLVRRAAATMMARRTLWAPIDEVYTPGANDAWRNLRSGEVLSEAEGGRVVFSHNVLFDYATSVELLDEDPSSLEGFLEEEPDRALFLRPTLNYFFARLWFTNRDRFWEVFWALIAHQEAHVRLVGQVLPPGLLAQEARQLEDAAPLLENLQEATAHAATATLRVLQAIQTHQVRRDELWARFAADAASHPSVVFAWDMARFLFDALDRLDDDTAGDPTRQNISVAARRLLRWALESHDPNIEHLAAVWLVSVTARTYLVDPQESGELLRSIVTRVGTPEMSIELTYRLADNVDHLFEPAPELVADLYRAVFSHAETSEEKTLMGGIVLALSSNRRQDFEMAQYLLTERAPKFIRQQPRVAIPALVTAAAEVIQLKEIRPYTEDVELPVTDFRFQGRVARYIPDRSHFWDASGTVPDDQDKLAAVLHEYLEELPLASDALTEAIALYSENAGLAFFWRKLLEWGAQAPVRYGDALRDLLLAEPILTHPETAPEAASFLGSVEQTFPDDAIAEVEATVVRVAEQADERVRHWCRRIMARIPEERLRTQVGRVLLAEAREDDAAQSNRPLVSFSGFTEVTDPNDWLRDEGVQPDQPANRRILAATEALAQFATQYVNETAVPLEETQSVVAAIGTAMGLLAEASDLPGPLTDMAWARVGDAAAVAARVGDIADNEFDVLRRAVLACARGEAPRPPADGEDTFNFPGWSPAARNEAAEGVPRLLARREDSELEDALRALAQDPVPSVRYLLVRDLPRIIARDEDLFWQVAELYAAQETNHLVQQAFVQALAIAAASPERERRVTELFGQLLARTSLAEMGRRIAGEDQSGILLIGLAVARGNEWAARTLTEAIAEVPPAYLSTLALHLLHFVSWERAAGPQRENAERALGWLPQVVARVELDLREQIELPSDERDGDRIGDLFSVIDQIISRLYFGSGVYRSAQQPDASREAICEFFSLARPHLRSVAELAGGEHGVGLPPRTAHHFIELLRGTLACDPAEVLHLARLAVDAARGVGYAFDSMAAREVTGIIETTLADHREVARGRETLDDLMTVLDAFVEAGWPEAQRLVWRLEELFR